MLGATNITSKGLLQLCRRMPLTELHMGKKTVDQEGKRNSKYSDEGAVIVARNLPNLQSLWTDDIELGVEGLAAVALHFAEMVNLSLSGNRSIVLGCSSVGRMANLRKLYLGTDELTQLAPTWRTGRLSSSPVD